jgi:hypothetical protein
MCGKLTVAALTARVHRIPETNSNEEKYLSLRHFPSYSQARCRWPKYGPTVNARAGCSELNPTPKSLTNAAGSWYTIILPIKRLRMLHPETQSRAQPRPESPAVFPILWPPVGDSPCGCPRCRPFGTPDGHAGSCVYPNRIRAGVPCRAVAMELRKNEVRRKLECPEDSMSCYDFGEPPVGALVSGVTAFESAPVPEAAVTLESSPGPLKTTGSENSPGAQDRLTVTTRAAGQADEAGILKKTRRLQKCDPINDLNLIQRVP